MAFTSQTFSEQGVGGGGITSTADSLMYIRREDGAKIAAAWGTHQPVIVSVLDTEGLPAMVMFSNSPNGKPLDYKKLTSSPMVTEALNNGKTRTLYTVGWFRGQRPHYYDSSRGIHIEMVNPYIDNRDVLPKFISGGDTIHEGYLPFGLYANASEYAASDFLDTLATKNGNREEAVNQNDAGKTSDQLVGDPFTRSYDAPGVDPSMYWLDENM